MEGHNVFTRACLRDQQIALELLNRKLVTREMLNVRDRFGSTVIHMALKGDKPFWKLATVIVIQPNIERATLEGVDRVLKCDPSTFAQNLGFTREVRLCSMKLKEMIKHKIEKIRKKQHEKKASGNITKVGEKKDSAKAPTTVETDIADNGGEEGKPGAEGDEMNKRDSVATTKEPSSGDITPSQKGAQQNEEEKFSE
jgi:hypothetical protein